MRDGSTGAMAAGTLPDLASLEEAQERLRGVVRRTPLHPSGWLSERAGAPVYLKLECWQVTHSFKVRGAFNAISTMDAEERGRGLVTASAGNHGLAVAHAARLNSATATVFVPADAPRTKKTRIRRLGADLREVGASYDDAAAAARAFAAETGARLVHPFNDRSVVAGQGTVGLEILDQLPDVREVIVPVGGGGLIAGVGAAVRARGGGAHGGAHGSRAGASGRPDGTRVLGVQTTATCSMYDAFEAGRVVPFAATRTLCDGLAGETEAEAYDRARLAVDDLRLVDDARIGHAIRALYEQEGIVAEGAGAVGVAAVLEGTFHLDGPTVIVVSGGNIDGEPLARILLEN